MPLPFLSLVGSFGALALVAQVVLIRQLMVAFYGSELVIALGLAGWLAGVFLGARAAGWLAAGPLAPPGRVRWGLALGSCLWILVLSGELALSYSGPGRWGLTPGELPPFSHVIGMTLLLTLPGSLFVAGLLVLAGNDAAVKKPETDPAGRSVGAVLFGAESAGSLIGLLIHSFFLTGRWGPVETLFGFSWMMVLALAWALIPKKTIRQGAVLVLAVLGVLAYGNGLVKDWDGAAGRLRFEATHPGYRLLAEKDTPYQHLALAQRGEQFTLFGDRSLLAAWPDPWQYQPLTAFFLSEAPPWPRVLLAGRGLGGFVHEFLRENVGALTYVTLDPAETDLIRSHLPPDLARDLSDPRLNLVHDDLRRYLARTGETFDLIVINAPDPDNARINRLYTREFFQAAQGRLTPAGSLITSVSGADNFWNNDLASFGRSLYRTLTDLFPRVVVTPGDIHYFVAGSEASLVTDDPRELADRFEARGYRRTHVRPKALTAFFPPTHRAWLKDRLAAVGLSPTPANTDARPLAYVLRLIWWEKMTGSPWLSGLLSAALEAGSWAPWAGLLAVGPLLFLVFRPVPPVRRAAWIMGYTGAAAMGLNLFLLFLYQNRYGVLYRDLGLLSALFMAGLTAGSFLGRGLAARKGALGGLMAGTEGLFVLAALGTAWSGGRHVPGLIPGLVVLTGLAGGTQFALLFAYGLSDPDRPSITEVLSRLEAADHGGAVIGALVAGLVVAPVVGLTAGSLYLAGLKAVGMLVLIRSNVFSCGFR